MNCVKQTSVATSATPSGHWQKVRNATVSWSKASPTYCVLFGKSLQELTTSSYQPKIHPDDITDRKQAEEEIQRERAFFDQLVETAPEGIAISDTQGRVLRVNAEFVRMFGYGVDEVVGQCLDDLVAPPARQEAVSYTHLRA